jgi:hypothetical protein
MVMVLDHMPLLAGGQSRSEALESFTEFRWRFESVLRAA